MMMDHFVQRKYHTRVCNSPPGFKGVTCGCQPQKCLARTQQSWNKTRRKKKPKRNNVILSLCRRYFLSTKAAGEKKNKRIRSDSPLPTSCLSLDGINNNREEMLADDGAATMTTSIAIEFQMIGVFFVFQSSQWREKNRKMTSSVIKSSLCCRYV